MEPSSSGQEPSELDRFFSVSLDLLCIASTDGYFLRLNPAWETTLGYARDQLKTKRFLDFVHADDLEGSLKALATLASQQTVVDFVNRYRRQDGDYRWLQWRAAPAGNMIYAAARDITEQRQADEALRQSDRRYKDFIAHSNEGVWRMELEQPIPIGLPEEEIVQRILEHGVIAECNLAFARNRGFSTVEEVVGKRVNATITASNPDEGRIETLRSAVRGGFRSRTVEFRSLDKTGSPKRFLRTEIPIVENGMLVRSWGITRDLTELRLTEESLRESEERFRTTFENAGIGMAIVDTGGHPIKCNPTLQRMLGYSEEELGRMLFTEFTHPDDCDLDMGLYRELIAGKLDKYEIEKRYLRKNGQVVWGLLNVSLIRDSSGTPKYAVGMVEDITVRRRATEELRRSFEQLRALAGRLQTVREEERKRVAREIHDELGQALTAIKIDLSSLIRDAATGEDQFQSKAQSITRLVDDTIQSVRRIAAELRPGLLDDLGLVAAVEWAAEEFEARTGTKCHLDLPQDDLVIDPEHATAIFRILQETLTNVARHAKASQVNVRLAREDGDLCLEVSDNGVGITDEQLSAGRSLGILGMRERAMLLGGKLIIRGVSPGGTTVTVRIPEAHRA
jgi:two-component system, NarL family, sensor histidine kinase UhpB